MDEFSQKNIKSYWITIAVSHIKLEARGDLDSMQCDLIYLFYQHKTELIKARYGLAAQRRTEEAR